MPIFSFCVACVTWQTHRDHIVHPRHLRRRHTFRFRSITFEGMHWFHSKSAEVYSNAKYRSSSILVIIRQIWPGSWPFFDFEFLLLGYVCRCILVCSITLIPLEVVWWYLVEMRRSTVGLSFARETTLNFFLIYSSPLKPKYCTGNNSHTVWDNLILFGSDIYQVK